MSKKKNKSKKNDIIHIKVDTGSLPPGRAKEYLDKIRDDVKSMKLKRKVFVTAYNVDFLIVK